MQNNFYNKVHTSYSTLWPQRGISFLFLPQYHPWIKYEGHENKRNDHRLQKLLIVRQILLVGT